MPEDARRPCDRRCIDDSSFEWTPINPANDPPCSPSHELTCNPPYYKPRQTTPCHVSRDTPCEPPPISPGDIPSISPLYTPSIPLRKSPLKSSCFPQKQPYTEPTHLAQKHAPWNDLHQRYTLSSSRHEVYHYDPQAPRDSLDFILKSQYNQHGEFLRGMNQTLVQPETLGMDHKLAPPRRHPHRHLHRHLHHRIRRVLKNRVYQEPPAPKPMNHPLRIAESKRKDLTHSLKNAIDGHHTQTTNRGYARKLDGGFFTS